MSKIFNTALPIVGSVVLTSAAFAGNSIVASYTYDSLSGSYVMGSPVTGVFNANAVSGAVLNTVGDFNRILPTSQNASFPAGFVADANPADISLTVNVTVIGVNQALGTGTLTVTDIDGDQFTTGLSGIWTRTSLGVNFNAAMVNPVFVDNGALDGTFNGYAGGWSMDFGPGALTGANVALVISSTGFFNTNFSDRPVGVSGQILPTPGALALGFAGTVVVLRRRREV